jgi:AraC-like DNA-binding protein
MRDLSQLPALTPEILLSARPLPPPRGPVRFLLGNAATHQKPALLRDCFAQMRVHFDVGRLSGMPLEVDLAMNALPGLVMALGSLHGSRLSRTRTQIEADNSDDIALMMSLNGPLAVAQGRREVELGNGEAILVSCTDSCSYTHLPPGELMALRLPRAQFAPLVNGVHDRYMQKIPSDVPALRFLTSYVQLAWEEQTTASREMQHLVVTHAYDLMALMVGATRDAAYVAHGRGFQAARLHAIKQDIATNLHDHGLSAATLADRHGCTPRSVQRLFEAEGTTFSEYVLAQRLTLAHRLLSDPRREADKISAVAYDCGFGDVSYFNRMFRRRFGAVPSDIRAQARLLM